MLLTAPGGGVVPAAVFAALAPAGAPTKIAPATARTALSLIGDIRPTSLMVALMSLKCSQRPARPSSGRRGLFVYFAGGLIRPAGGEERLDLSPRRRPASSRRLPARLGEAEREGRGGTSREVREEVDPDMAPGEQAQHRAAEGDRGGERASRGGPYGEGAGGQP